MQQKIMQRKNKQTQIQIKPKNIRDVFLWWKDLSAKNVRNLQFLLIQ